MSEDWKRRIEERRQREVEEREKAARKKREDKKQRAEAKVQKELAAWERSVKEHQRKFRCHIRGCTHVSRGPKEKGRYYERHEDFGSHSTSVFVGTGRYDWNDPTGLEKYLDCGKWTCWEHLYSGICKECA